MVVKGRAMACNSLWDDERAGAGVYGEEGRAGWPQQAGAHPPQLERQQESEPAAGIAPLLTDAAVNPCQARTNPSPTTTAVFPRRNAMLHYTLLFANPFEPDAA